MMQSRVRTKCKPHQLSLQAWEVRRFDGRSRVKSSKIRLAGMNACRYMAVLKCACSSRMLIEINVICSPTN